MSRRPIGARAMTDAERQRRRREKLREQQPIRDSHDIPQSELARVTRERDAALEGRQKAEEELQVMRQRVAAMADGARAPDDELARVTRERDDALARVLEIAAELRQAHSQLRWQGREHAPTGPEISKPLFRWLLGELHPDRNVDPAAKEYLSEVFVRFKARVEGGGEGRLPTKEEMKQNRAETYRKNRERGLKGAATRKKNREAKQAAAGDNGTSGGK